MKSRTLSYLAHDYKKNTWILLLDDVPWKEVKSPLFKESDLRPLIGLKEADFFALEYRLVNNFCLRKLSQRSYSSYEMEKLLYDQLVSKETVERVISESIQLGYIDDADWIQRFIRRCSGKNMGARAVAQKLQAKGVPADEIDLPLAGWEEEHPATDRIRELLAAKYSECDFTDERERQKLIARLIRRGFRYEEIKEALRSFLID